MEKAAHLRQLLQQLSVTGDHERPELAARLGFRQQSQPGRQAGVSSERRCVGRPRRSGGVSQRLPDVIESNGDLGQPLVRLREIVAAGGYVNKRSL